MAATLRAILDSTQFQVGAKVINSSIANIKKDVGSAGSAFDKLTSKLGALGSSLGLNVGLAAGFSGLVDAAVRLQKYETTMTSFTGSLAAAKEELVYVLDTANQFGVSFQGIAAPFSKFAAAAEGFSKLEVHKVFEAFVTASSGLQLNMQEVNGVFLALQQIVSKGKVSMEELRLQLAERVPGAMKLAAKAAGMSMSDFEAAVRSGTIDARKWLVDFAELIQEKFAAAADVAKYRLQASIMRLGNSFLLFKGQIMEASGASEDLVRIFDNIGNKIFKNEKIIKSLGDVLGNLTGRLADYIEGLDEQRITEFADGLSDIMDSLLEGGSAIASGLLDFITKPEAWEGVKQGAIALGDVAKQLGNLITVATKLPGDMVDYGLIGYALFGSFGPARVYAILQAVANMGKDKLIEDNPEDFGEDLKPKAKILTEIILEALFGIKKDVEEEIAKDPISMEFYVAPEATIGSMSNFEKELAMELRTQKELVESAMGSMKSSASYISTIKTEYGELMKSAVAAWDGIKSASSDAGSQIINDQMAAARGVSDLYKKALVTDGLKAVNDFKVGLQTIGEAMKKSLSDEQLFILKDSLKDTAEAGVKYFTSMGKDIAKVLKDIAAKEKELKTQIEGYAKDIEDVQLKATNRRFEMVQSESTELEKYNNIIIRTNWLFAKGNALTREAQGLEGESKNKALEKANEYYERGLELSKDLNDVEDGTVSKTKLKKDLLTYINGYENNSLKNLKAMKSDSEKQLENWQKIKKELEGVQSAIQEMVTLFTSGMEINLDSSDAKEQIESLVNMINDMGSNGALGDLSLDGMLGGIDTVGDTWDDVISQMSTDHTKATNKAISELSAIEKAIKKAFSWGDPQYDVSVNGSAVKLREGGRIPGYGGGDGYNADTERGEYVLPKESASYYSEDFLEALRTRKYPKEGSQVAVMDKAATQKGTAKSDTLTVRLDLPVSGEPIEVQASYANAANLKAQLSEMAKFSS